MGLSDGRCASCGQQHNIPAGSLCSHAGEKVMELLTLLPTAKQMAPNKLADIRLLVCGWEIYAAAGMNYTAEGTLASRYINLDGFVQHGLLQVVHRLLNALAILLRVDRQCCCCRSTESISLQQDSQLALVALHLLLDRSFTVALAPLAPLIHSCCSSHPRRHFNSTVAATSSSALKRPILNSTCSPQCVE